MSDKLIRKLQNALKLSGFSVRREFCNLIVSKLTDEGKDLQDIECFDSNVKSICECLENQNLTEQSIEKDHIERALEACLHSGYDQHETVFNVINAFDFPKLSYDPDRKLYSVSNKKSKFLADADSKYFMFLERYQSILQRTRRNLLRKNNGKFKLQSVDYLLTLSNVTLDTTLILGSILTVSNGKYFLEDPSGRVELDLTHAKYAGGYFPENIFVLVNGYYDDKILHVSSLVLPSGEPYTYSKPSFGNINYFGGPSHLPLRDSQKLKDHMIRFQDASIQIFSDVWLDQPATFEKLATLFEGNEGILPTAIIFMGNFTSVSHGSDLMDNMRKSFKKLADLILQYPYLVQNTHFVFVPGLNDPCTPNMIPRLPLPRYVSDAFQKLVPKSIFATNPCRIQYCNREIVVFRADIMQKFLQGTIKKPSKDEMYDCTTRTIVSQGHLCPMSLNALTVHWEFDYTLRLYPLPDLIVIGEKTEAYKGEHDGSIVVNPGPFSDNGFNFQQYTPFDNTLCECEVP